LYHKLFPAQPGTGPEPARKHLIVEAAAGVVKTSDPEVRVPVEELLDID
jgi:hypothetical protein